MFSSLKKSLSKSLARAGEILTGSGPSNIKQFHTAILEGDEDKAIILYTKQPDGSQVDTKAVILFQELPPSKPIPSKKNPYNETPLMLAVRNGMERLVKVLLEHGGDPAATNTRKETCLHILCSKSDHEDLRAKLLDFLIEWQGKHFETGEPMEKVSVNCVDIDGNLAIHYAAANGLVSCVERLVTLGAIISLVNRTNLTCCEMADEKGFKELASMLELALVFQPDDIELSGFESFRFEYNSVPGRLLLDTKSLTSSGLDNLIEESIVHVSVHLGWMDAKAYRSRAEALLHQYAWDVDALVNEYIQNTEKVLSAAKMDPSYKSPRVFPAAEDKKEADDDHIARMATTSTPQTKQTTASDGEVVAGTTTNATESPTPAHGENVEEKKPADPMPGSIDLDLGDIQLEDEKPIGSCNICGESMYSEKDVMYYIHSNNSKNNDELEYRALSCMSGHTFCMNCWSNHLAIQINENGLGYLPCAGFKCGEILDFQWAPILLKSQEAVNRMLANRRRHIIDCAGFKACPIEGCGLVVHVPKKKSRSGSNVGVPSTPATTNGATAAIAVTSESTLPCSGICNNGHCFCLLCAQPAHSPCTCEIVPRWFQLVKEETQGVVGTDNNGGNGDDIANALWVAANTKRCPRCSTAIEKDEGCNHMSCRKCKKEFCWICMQDWSLHSENTGGYFQCNRFVDSNASGAAAGGGGALDLEADVQMWAMEEMGNAHAETMRLKMRKHTMARFIHHFTRFQAHGQSLTMETSKSLDTLKRVHESLIACQQKKLKWFQGDRVANPLDELKALEVMLETGVGEKAEPTSPSKAVQKKPEEEEEREDAVPALVAAAAAAAASFVASPSSTSNVKLSSSPENEKVLSTPAKESSSPNTNKFRSSTNWSEEVVPTFFCSASKKHLEFLNNGFEELLKCRTILQWSYPYAYFEFQDNDPNDYNSSRHNRRPHGHRFSFEAIQADLESLVETLSDVVARRRLRAGRSQIIQATCAAKQKRIDFENLLVTYARDQQQRAANGDNTPNQDRSSSTPGSRQARSNSNPGSRGNRRYVPIPSQHRDPSTSSGLRRRGRPPVEGGLFEASDELFDPTELAGLLMEMEYATAMLAESESAVARSSDSNGRVDDERAAALERLRRRQAEVQLRLSDIMRQQQMVQDSTDGLFARRRESRRRASPTNRRAERERERQRNTGGDSSNSDTEGDRPRETGTPERGSSGSPSHRSTTRTQSESGSSRRHRDREQRERDRERAMRDRTARNREQAIERGAFRSPGSEINVSLNDDADSEEEAVAMLQLATLDDSHDAFARLNDRQLHRMARRAEEETELNRAILMSLQYAGGDNNTTGGTNSTANNDNEESVNTLMAMGFTREQSQQALRESNNNVEIAANQLLGLDF